MSSTETELNLKTLKIDCPICDEKEAWLESGAVLHDFQGEHPGQVAIKCKCGISELVEADDAVGILMDILGVTTYSELFARVVYLLNLEGLTP